MLIRVGNLIVINTYVSEGWKLDIVNSVTRLSRQCVTDGLDVIVVGDFNLVPEEMEKKFYHVCHVCFIVTLSVVEVILVSDQGSLE